MTTVVACMPTALFRTLVLVVALVPVAGCSFFAGSPALPSPEELVLEGTSWRAVSVAGQPVPAEDPPTIRFAGGRIEGSSGCNSYGGDARLVDGRLVAGEIAQTLMLCDEPRNAIETAFTTILRENNRVGLVDGRLVIAGEAGEIVFEPLG